MTFEIYPAIDLRHGRVVRLKWGDPQWQTVFDDEPLRVGRRWIADGATWLHVVNLDGAFSEGGESNLIALQQLSDLGARIQFGGGLRTMEDIERAMSLGAWRVVLGTVALEHPHLVAEAVARFGVERVAAGIDARDGRVRTRGWQTETEVGSLDLAKAMVKLGVKTVIFTDISRDGVMTGANINATADLAGVSGLKVIASGGVNSIADIAGLRALAPTGVAGVIIGRALYEGAIDLAEAIALTREDELC